MPLNANGMDLRQQIAAAMDAQMNAGPRTVMGGNPAARGPGPGVVQAPDAGAGGPQGPSFGPLAPGGMEGNPAARGAGPGQGAGDGMLTGAMSQIMNASGAGGQFPMGDQGSGAPVGSPMSGIGDFEARQGSGAPADLHTLPMPMGQIAQQAGFQLSPQDRMPQGYQPMVPGASGSPSGPVPPQLEMLRALIGNLRSPIGRVQRMMRGRNPQQ